MVNVARVIFCVYVYDERTILFFVECGLIFIYTSHQLHIHAHKHIHKFHRMMMIFILKAFESMVPVFFYFFCFLPLLRACVCVYL